MFLLIEVNFSVNFVRYKDWNYYILVVGLGNFFMFDKILLNIKSFYI